MRCISCNFETENSKEFEDHLKKEHFMDYLTYIETVKLLEHGEENFCYRCNNFQKPMSFSLPDQYYQPCLNCIPQKKTAKAERLRRIVEDIKDYYDRILGDRYLQLYNIDSIYPQSTFPHNYAEFKSVLSELDLPNRNDIWFVDFVPGYPKTICRNNLRGLKIINLNDYYKVESEKDSLKINNYEIQFSDIVNYDVRHHSRYSLLNPTSDRKAKRLRLPGTDKCIKFYNRCDGVRTIFRLLKDGEEILPNSINFQDKIIIKLALLRNKNYIRLVFDVISEIMSKPLGIFKDAVFLRNTIPINIDADSVFWLDWDGCTFQNDLEGDKIVKLSIF